MHRQKQLYEAIEKGDLFSIEQAIEDGADINETDVLGDTSLHWAAELGYEDVVKYLVEEHHANVNALNGEGYVPLCIATLHGFKNVVEYLADHGADLNRLGKLGDIALNSAAKYELSESVIKRIIDQYDDINKADHQ